MACVHGICAWHVHGMCMAWHGTRTAQHAWHARGTCTARTRHTCYTRVTQAWRAYLLVCLPISALGGANHRGDDRGEDTAAGASQSGDGGRRDGAGSSRPVRAWPRQERAPARCATPEGSELSPAWPGRRAESGGWRGRHRRGEFRRARAAVSREGGRALVFIHARCSRLVCRHEGGRLRPTRVGVLAGTRARKQDCPEPYMSGACRELRVVCCRV
mgnify:CR=1 FL=1